jgi:hypothetical protein
MFRDSSEIDRSIEIERKVNFRNFAGRKVKVNPGTGIVGVGGGV